ncbi:MAG: DUF4974 domain-containing protein [Bacteroides sp.]|nr:DUF4974 domain-containing protein [Bacteroides sp.]
MTSDSKIKDCILIAEELAQEFCTGRVSTSLLANSWKEENPTLYTDLKKQEHLAEELAFHDAQDAESALRETEKYLTVPPKRITVWPFVRIAASVLLVVGMATLWLLQKESKVRVALPVNITSTTPQSTSILNNQLITSSASAFTVKGNQLLSRSEDGEENVSITLKKDNGFNKLVVPPGGEYRLTLEEGTEIQINGASELLFPTRFMGASRNVRLSGEAFFQVKTDKEKPFQVAVDVLKIVATGTSFNIRAYKDEDDIQVSLIEGAIHICKGEEQLAVLSPGQTLNYTKSTGTFEWTEVTQTAVTDWTAGKFIFHDEPIEQIMKELSRWYNVKITVSPEISQKRYSGILSRKQPLEDILKSLHLTNELDFKINGNNSINAMKMKNEY